MNTISTRIQLINSYRPFIYSKTQSLENRLFKCQFGLCFSGFILILISGFGFTAILLETVGIRDVYEWNKMGFFIFLFIGSSYNFKNNVYQYLLLKHIRFLNQNAEVFVEYEINEELQKIIRQLNKPIASVLLITTAGVLVVGAIINLLLTNQFSYWEYFKVPFIFYTLYFFNYFWNKYKQLIGNLIQVEVEY
jgi:hypothetical protein